MDASKQKFRFTYDDECVIVYRRDFFVEASTVEEAQEILKNIIDKHTYSGDVERELGDTFGLWDSDGELQYDTMRWTGKTEVRCCDTDKTIFSTED